MPARRLRLPAGDLRDTRGFRKQSSPFFVLRTKPNTIGHIRFAVIVSLKVDRLSTGRNKLKRRTSGRLQKIDRAQDMIVTLLPPAKRLSRVAFSQELEKMLF